MTYGKEIGLILLAGALVLPGCGDDDDKSPTTSASGATGGSGGATAGSGGSGNGGSGGSTAGGSGGVATGGTGGATGGTGGAVGGSGGATGGSGGSGAGPAGKANPPTPGAQIDRAGRSVITGALIETFNADTGVRDTARDAYNSNSDPSSWASSHKGQIKASLGILDSLDAVCGNQLVADQTAGDRYDFLAGVLADDQLYVLTSEGTCGVYLGLEADIVGVPNIPANCGGRMPADDVINRSYSVLANGSLGDVDDTIAVDDKPASTTVPFLSAP